MNGKRWEKDFLTASGSRGSAQVFCQAHPFSFK